MHYLRRRGLNLTKIRNTERQLFVLFLIVVAVSVFLSAGIPQLLRNKLTQSLTCVTQPYMFYCVGEGY